MQENVDALNDQKLKSLDTLHIPVWLAKDIAWILVYKPLGVAMILPAVFIAVYICIKTISEKLLFFQNLAILFWISANSTWMAGEFFDFSYKGPAMVLFLLGVISIARHYYLEVKLKPAELTKPYFARFFSKNQTTQKPY
ncbi:hypothetical protein [Schleiferia thermophila]|uniref:hypothetical protein n=1 Tax=Schleiferia thermophila TaxID=884107 RepID=UPI0004E64108|nr:hypothetical protein [Schleiferia thermophila]KFD40244.1 hypothetical protein AT05_00630 [Schleiferia thermophila str. Yellowstone]GCD79129.1 hypothetical protein JCM30197_03760 [Schleiferia thermophila]